MFDHCLYFNTTALARRLEQEWAQAFADFGLSPAQAFMLRAVLARPGLQARQLAESMSIAKSTATRSLDFLADKGYIERQPGSGDAREKCVFPTTEAVAIHAALNQASGAVTARLKAMMGSAEFSDLVKKIKTARTELE